MTPLEKAVEASMSAFDGFYCLTDDDVRAIISAFLEAAAEDAGARVALQAAFYDNHSNTIAASRAAILALKETING